MILFRTLHKAYVQSWADYEKGSSYKDGARWNRAGTPVIYMSSNVQNAMLELSNYNFSPRGANLLSVIGVFECSALRLYEVRTEDLPAGWEQYPFVPETQDFGSDILMNDDYDGLIAPSCAINDSLVRLSQNEVRRSIYANVILNPTKDAVRNMQLINTFEPIYSERMFA